MLLAKVDQDCYWILPSGRVELGEDTRADLWREILEETGREARVEDLLWDTERVFHLDGSDHYKLVFTHAVPPTVLNILDNARTHRTLDEDTPIELRGFDLDHLEAVPFRLSFSKAALERPNLRSTQSSGNRKR